MSPLQSPPPPPALLELYVGNVGGKESGVGERLHVLASRCCQNRVSCVHCPRPTYDQSCGLRPELRRESCSLHTPLVTELSATSDYQTWQSEDTVSPSSEKKTTQAIQHVPGARTFTGEPRSCLVSTPFVFQILQPQSLMALRLIR